MTRNDNYPKANGLSLLKHFLHEEQNHAVGDLTTSCAVYRPGWQKGMEGGQLD
jgi:hypothetical protein